MSGYTVKITAKLPVDATNVQGMAVASKLIATDLMTMLQDAGFRDVTIEPEFKARLKFDAMF